MATSTQHKASERMVVLLRPTEKQRLQRLARKERVSSAEIMRRSLAAYSIPKEEVSPTALAEMNVILDRMIAKIASTREHVQKNAVAIQAMRAANE